MEGLSATQGKLSGDAMLWAVCDHGKCTFLLTKITLFQAVSLHHRFPPRHMESSVVCLHHSNRASEFHGGEGPHPGQHRDIRLHGEVWQRLARGLVALWPPTFHPRLILPCSWPHCRNLCYGCLRTWPLASLPNSVSNSAFVLAKHHWHSCTPQETCKAWEGAAQHFVPCLF